MFARLRSITIFLVAQVPALDVVAQEQLFRNRTPSVPTDFSCRLSPAQEFGLEELDPNEDYDLSRRQLRYGGPMLASISDVAVDSAGRLYVLDRGFSKIAVFNPDGRLHNVILGGEGEGPGEFIGAFSLSLRGDSVVVTDVELRRIVTFSKAGDLIGSVNVPSIVPHDVEIDENGNLWVLNQQRLPSEPAVTVFDSLGNVIHEYFGADSEERERIPRISQEPGDLFSVGREIWYASPRASTWWRYDPDLAGPFGVANFPLVEMQRLSTGQLLAGTGTREAGLLGPGRVAVLYYRATTTDDLRFDRLFDFIDVLSVSGNYESTCMLPAGLGAKSFALAPDGAFIYLPSFDPFPRVIKYQIDHQPGGMQ